MKCNIQQSGGSKVLRKDSGFSLVEILAALVMAVIIFSAAGYALSVGFNTVQVSREQLRANQICLARVEGIRLCRWTDQLFNTNYVPLSFPEGFYPVGLGATNAYVVYSGTLTLDTNFSFSPKPSYTSNLCLVTVTVTWSDRSFSSTKTRTYTMKTLVSKTGVQNYVYYH